MRATRRSFFVGEEERHGWGRGAGLELGVGLRLDHSAGEILALGQEQMVLEGVEVRGEAAGIDEVSQLIPRYLHVVDTSKGPVESQVVLGDGETALFDGEQFRYSTKFRRSSSH